MVCQSGASIVMESATATRSISEAMAEEMYLKMYVQRKDCNLKKRAIEMFSKNCLITLTARWENIYSVLQV